MSVAWLQSRYDKAGPGGSGADYINCPLTRAQYDAFVDALLAGDKVAFHDWEATPYFDGCLPIEVMAERGRETLRHGPMKPFGLTNPHAPDVKPYAVVQLRQDNRLGTLFNMVGFQTKLKHGEQIRIFRTIPGPGEAPSSRGSAACTATPSSIRRSCSTARCGSSAEPRLRFAGQITGCEGYVESAAIGLLAGRFAAAERLGEALIAAAADHRARRAARPHHRRPRRNASGDCGPALVPADERQFRPVSAARACAQGRKRRAAARYAKRRWRRSARSPPRARRPRSLDRRRRSRRGRGMSA